MVQQRQSSSCGSWCGTVLRQLKPVLSVARWFGLLAVAVQRAFAASLLELPPAADLGDEPEPELQELHAEVR